MEAIALDAIETKKAHTVLLENREKITLTGVTDVQSFDENAVQADTDYGRLEIRGEALQVTSLALESGGLTVEGKIISFVYTAAPKNGGGLFSKVFGA